MQHPGVPTQVKHTRVLGSFHVDVIFSLLAGIHLAPYTLYVGPWAHLLTGPRPCSLAGLRLSYTPVQNVTSLL